MINPSNTKRAAGKVIEVEKFTSMVVYKIETRHGIFDYTLFGQGNDSLDIGTGVNATIGYSITLNGPFIKEIHSLHLTKVA